MATRSIIAVKETNTKVSYIYSHWDGYPQHVGKLLFENYNSYELIDKLISGGNISSLGKYTDIPENSNHSFDKPCEDITVYYGRDRGEKNQGFKQVKTVKELDKAVNNTLAEWVYYYDSSEGCFFFKHYTHKEYKRLDFSDVE